MKYSLYIHIPFCSHRCHYCDFNTYVGQDALIPAYADALINELRIVYKKKPDISIHSIYFGGGTPSIIPAFTYQKLFDEINDLFNITPDCEISLEANPSNLTNEYLRNLKLLGFNRISLGVQSTNNLDLKRLGRTHNIWDVLESIEKIKKSGFKNLNLDLIFGLPWQDLTGWENSLSRALQFKPEHFSIYSLIIEPGTPLFSWYQKGLISQQDQDLEGDMYETTINMMAENGYSQYEISNWAKKDKIVDYRCRHNMQYWLGYPYLGIGAGAHGFASGYRTVNTPTIGDYIQRCQQNDHISRRFPWTPAQIQTKKVDVQTQMMDFMLVGLRLIKEGVTEERFSNLFGKSMKKVFNKEIDKLISQGLVEWSDESKNRLSLTERGVMVANQVFMAFV
jgi:oxygen-independent coproporphyrinogen-3 oxidase